MVYKYPRTPHLPNSPGKAIDDITLFDLKQFQGKDVVATIKMDGECTTLAREYAHPRSAEGFDNHPANSWIKNFHNKIRHRIPSGVRICGENLYVRHSIYYTSLPEFFLGFSAWEGATCLSWVETIELFSKVGIYSVDVAYFGKWDEKLVTHIGDKVIKAGEEGIVVRVADSFEYADFGSSVAKYRGQLNIGKSHWKFGRVGVETNKKRRCVKK